MCLAVAACSSTTTAPATARPVTEPAATTTTAVPVEQRGEDVALPEVTGPVDGGVDGEPFLARPT